MKFFLKTLALSLFCVKSLFSVELNDVLPDPYPEVYEKVDLLPFDPHHWYAHHHIFKVIIPENDVKIAIEVGSWLGASTRDIAKLIPEDGIVFAVDTWQGSEEHQPGQICYHMPIDQLFRQFLSNVVHENLQNKIIPVRLPSVEAAKQLEALNIKADFIYLDAAHDYENIKKDLHAWYPYLREGGVFCGDDFFHPPIAQAVHEFAAENHLTVIAHSHACWRIIK